MRERKNIVLLFSKVPEVGLVKTRLTVLKDGMFPPETAARLYHCMLFDVVEIIMAALSDMEAAQAACFGADAAADAGTDADGVAGAGAAGTAGDACTAAAAGAGAAAGTAGDAGTAAAADADDDAVFDTYELVISTTPAPNVEVMRSLFSDAGEWPRPFTVIADEGASFDEHYNHAFAQCWDLGADCILSMGADMPALTKADVKFGFEQLHKLDGKPGGGIVLAPDQEMGVSVIGWTRETEFDHTGVFYNRDGLTVLPAYIKKAALCGLPALWLPPIPDIDTMADFLHNVTLVHALNYCANFDDICPPWRTAEEFIDLGFSEIRVAPNNLLDPRDHIDR